jgi:hypothetical protein
MSKWISVLQTNPIPCLLSSDDRALVYFVQRDLLGEGVDPIKELWETPDALKIVKKQQENGSWRYPGQRRNADTYTNYDLIETFRNLRLLVEMYGFNRDHPTIPKAASYVFSCQTGEGDIRGILGNQYIPYYHAAMMELLVKAGYEDDVRMDKGFEWLLSLRQNDGGWIIPMQAVPSKDRTDEMWRGAPIPPNRSRPFSHLATGMVLRAFAAHPRYRQREEARLAGEQLKTRFFKSDKYNDRKTPGYWLKFQYPFWWTDILTALDSLSRLGFSANDVDIQKGLDWFISNQGESGLWPTAYGKEKRAEKENAWVGLAICRVLKRFYE